MATRNGRAEWHGDLTSGSGRLVVGEERWESDYSFNSRFEGVLGGVVRHGLATNPEELLATAHAACFSMALSLVLGEAGYTPGTIETQAHVHLRNVGGLPTIQRIDLETAADVPGIDPGEFERRADEAATGCIISRALGGVEEIKVSAKLR
jgi:lipoyl-dependent peroxiredoxin